MCMLSIRAKYNILESVVINIVSIRLAPLCLITTST